MNKRVRHVLLSLNFFILVSALLFFSCNVNYNDVEIKNRLDKIEKELEDHEQRISAIELILENYSQLSSKIDSFNTDYESFKILVEDVKKDYEDISDKISKTSETPTNDLKVIEQSISSLSDRVTVIENTLNNYNQLVSSMSKISELETLTGNLGSSFTQLKTDFEKDIGKITEDLSKLPANEEIETINTSIQTINAQITALSNTTDALREEIEKSPDEYELSFIPGYFTYWKDSKPISTLIVNNKETSSISYSWRSGTINCGWSTGQKFNMDYLFYFTCATSTSTDWYYYNRNNGKYYEISGGTIVGTPSETMPKVPNDTKLRAFFEKYIEENTL